jgi:hypothetical protein
MPAVLQGAHCHPSEWPLTCGFSNPSRLKTASCPCGVRSSRVCLVSATQVLDHVPRSPAESRCVPFSRCHPAIPGAGRGTSLRRRKLSHLRNPVSAAISHRPPQITGPDRDRRGGADPHAHHARKPAFLPAARGALAVRRGPAHPPAPPMPAHRERQAHRVTCRASQAAIRRPGQWPRPTCDVPRR